MYLYKIISIQLYFLYSEDQDKYGKKSNTDSWNRNQNAKSFQDNKSSNWRSDWSPEKQYDNRRERTGTYSRRDGSQNDRFIKDKTANNRFDRDKSFNKYESDVSDRNSKGISRDGGNRFTSNERRYNRNNSSDKANSDKDSDTSSKDNDKRWKGGFKRNGFNDSRGESRDGGASGRLQTTNWSDKKPAYRANYRNEKFNGIFNTYKNII